MSKKGSSAPAPDPRLVEAQIRSMGIQDDMIQRVIAMGETMQPLQMEQLRLGLDTARMSQQQASEDRAWALGRRAALTRAQDDLIDEADRFNETDRARELMDVASGDITQAFDAARGMEARGLSRMGVNPNDGRYRSFARQSGFQEALAKANAGQKVRLAARAEGLQLKSNAANMLSGYPSMASGLTGSGFGFGTAGLGLANTGAAGLTAGYNAAGGMAGAMGANATNMWNAQAQYKTNQDHLWSQSDPTQTLLGVGAGAFTNWGIRKVVEKWG